MIDERVKRLRISIVGCGHICIDAVLYYSPVCLFGLGSVCCLCRLDGPWKGCISHNIYGTNKAKV